jgi:hypothetical protein
MRRLLQDNGSRRKRREFRQGPALSGGTPRGCLAYEQTYCSRANLGTVCCRGVLVVLDGKVVVVTGAGNGVGAEIAKLAAKCGAKVVVNDAGRDARRVRVVIPRSRTAWSIQSKGRAALRSRACAT